MQNANFPFPYSLEERYKSPRFISAGGAGAVYSALDTNLNKKVAIKLLSISSGDQKLLRFQQEAKVIGKFTHPNIVKAMDFGIVDETVAYLVLELVGDASLNTLIQRKDQLSISKCLNIFRQICAGMRYAHEQGVLHRDLKPSNVLLENSASDNPIAKVADFGIAKIAGTLIFATTGNIYIGTPAFTSPEQFAGEDVDERSDVYSFGCLMYATLSGTTPFVADNTTELAFKHINEPVPPLEMTYGGEEIPVSLQELIGACLEKTPADRYEKFTEVAEALEQAQREWSDFESDKASPNIETISITPSSNPYKANSDNVPFKLNENRRSKQILATVLVLIFSLAAAICTKLFGFEPHSSPMNTSSRTTKITVVEKEVARELTLSESRHSAIPKITNAAAKLPDSYLAKSVTELIKCADNEMGEQRHTVALAYLNRAIKKQPQNSKALKLRSDCKKELNDYGGALLDIDAAIRLSQNDDRLLIRRAHLRRETDNLKGSLDDYSRCIELNPSNSKAYKEKAKVHQRMEQADEAIKDYTSGLKVDPSDDSMLRGRARVFIHKNDYEKALADCNKALAIDKSDENYKFRGDAFFSMKQFQKAVDDYSSAIKIRDSAEYHRMRASCYEKLGRLELAKQDRECTAVFE